MTDEELNIEIAEKVMGWKPHSRNTAEYAMAESAHKVHATLIGSVREWQPATIIKQAFMVVQKMRERGYWLSLNTHTERDEYKWIVDIGKGSKRWEAFNLSLPKAICLASLAALKAVESEGK